MGVKRNLGLFIVALASASVQAASVKIALADNWKFYQGDRPQAEQVSFDASGWGSVSVPHTWNTDLIKNQTDKKHCQGVGWYRTTLPVTSEMKGRRLFLRFEGALAVADVFVNGKKAGRHEGGYTAFCFEVTDLMNWNGADMVAVKVDNSDNQDVIPPDSRLFTRFGGIYRPVTLLVTDPTCVTPLDYASSGVFIQQANVSEKTADLTVTTKLSNGLGRAEALTVKTCVLDASGQRVAEVTSETTVAAGATVPAVQKMKIDAPHLWNGRQDPYLYQVKVAVSRAGAVVDEVIQPLGFRFFKVDAAKGFFLNGKPYKMYGVCRHQEWEDEGSALTFAHHQHDVAEMMDIGATTVRLAHYPQAADMYSLCDTNGLIVWAEIPFVQGYKSKRTPAFENGKQQLLEMIRQNYNNPSIIFWGLYNECWIPPEQVQVLHDMAKAEDPVRLTTAASNQKLSDKHHITDVVCWNKYPRWYGGFDLEAWADAQRKSQPNLKVGISEYGAGGCVDQHQLPPKKPNPTKGRFFPEEYMNQIHEEVWPMLATRDYLWGTYIWNMFDFSWPGVTRGSRINLNNKGLITYDRKTKKDPYFYYKANWSQEPVLYITSRRFTARTDAVTDVKVYSNCDQIELSLNGEKFPAPHGAYGVYVWPNLSLAEGENQVKVTAFKNGKVQEDACVWNYNPQGAPAPVVEIDRSVDVASVTASSYQKSKDARPAKAVDGDRKTFWVSQGPKKPQWLMLDLLQETDLGGVEIVWGNDGPYTYAVQVSNDGKMWTAVASVEKQKGQTQAHTFKATSRFVRVYCTGTKKDGWVGIRELKVLSE